MDSGPYSKFEQCEIAAKATPPKSDDSHHKSDSPGTPTYGRREKPEVQPRAPMVPVMCSLEDFDPFAETFPSDGIVQAGQKITVICLEPEKRVKNTNIVSQKKISPETSSAESYYYDCNADGTLSKSPSNALMCDSSGTLIRTKGPSLIFFYFLTFRTLG
jgi:hypothetical protein